jgi:ParB family chromosome partitioning protein
MAAVNKKLNINLTPIDKIFRDEPEGGVTLVALGKLKGFAAHPFKVRDDADMAELAESIAAEGVMVPLIVRPFGDGEYQIIAGHRRKRAAELAGLSEVPAIIKELDDDAAVAYMVDTNLARTKILPSEKAFAYKMKLDAMKRQAGRPKNNSTPLGQNFEGKFSVEVLSEQVGESRNQIQRYIRLTELVPELLDRVDSEQIPVRSGVELSYISEDGQRLIAETLADYEAELPGKSVGVSMKQAEELRSRADELDDELVCKILLGQPKPEKPPGLKLKLDAARITSFFSPGTEPDEIEETIIRLLERWSNGDESR